MFVCCNTTQGQMYYAVPYRNACQTVDPVNETEFNWIALIDNYFDCPGVAVSDQLHCCYVYSSGDVRNKDNGSPHVISEISGRSEIRAPQ